MRITDSILASNFVTSLNNAKQTINDLQTQIYTGSKINKPSDSPSGMARVLRLEDQISNNDSFIKNIDNSSAFVQTSIDTMQSIMDETQNIMVLFSDINNPTNQTSYSTYAERVNLAITSILDLANSQYDGKFLFGGTDFSTAKPYDFSAATVVNPVTGQNTTPVVQTVNTTGIQNVRINLNIIQKINTTGSELFGNLPSTAAVPPDAPSVTGNDIFNTLIRVRDNLKNGMKPADADVQIVNNFNEKILGKVTSSGETMSRLNSTRDLLDSQQMELKNLLAKGKDTDVAKAVIDLQNQQYFLEMSYKMSSMILPKSLLDFL